MEGACSSSATTTSYCYMDAPHILLVDAYVYDVQKTASMFKGYSWRVTVATSELEALKILGLKDAKHTPNKMPKIDLVCIDHFVDSSPSMNAYRLLKKIKGSKVTRDMPVVIVSADGINPHALKISGRPGANAMSLIRPLDGRDVKVLVKLMGFPAIFSKSNRPGLNCWYKDLD
ncbi:hypothetical protein OROMI_029613 [Orobanche minor]